MFTHHAASKISESTILFNRIEAYQLVATPIIQVEGSARLLLITMATTFGSKMRFFRPKNVPIAIPLLLLGLHYFPYSSHGFSVSRQQQTILEVSDQMASAEFHKYREMSHQIASQFVPTEFKPLSSLTNCHVQTISGVYLRNSNACKYISGSSGLNSLIRKSAKTIMALVTGKQEMPSSSDREHFWDERQRFETPDGDFFDVDFKYRNAVYQPQPNNSAASRLEPSKKGMVIILHGLQSNSNSSLSVDMARGYLQQGFDVACMNFRGCSGEMNRKMGGYHLGFTDDLKQFLGHLKGEREGTQEQKQSTSPARPPLYLSGFSLGANVALKALGELGEAAHRDYHIFGAAVCGAPFDQERNINFVQAPGFNRLIYMGFLLKSLRERSLEQLELFEGTEEWKKVSYEEVINSNTIADVENAVIAPLYGFQDNIDYYRQTSCLQFVDNITVPTLIINAADDPFFDPSLFPREKSCDFSDTSPIKMVRTDHGGHLGFMFAKEEHPADGDCKLDEEEFESKENERASWMPSELARFLSGVYSKREMMNEVEEMLGR